VALAWTVVVSLSWALGWFLTANVITDVRDGFAIFGASGAAAVTLLTGLALAAILRSGRAPIAAAPVITSAPVASGTR
jgi:hypothetical protein